jgi:hypothetical protein
VDVDVTKKDLLFKLSATSLLAVNALADMLPAGTWTSKFLFNFYEQDAKGGFQVFDGSKEEGVTVFQPMLFISHQIDETTNISGNFTLDAWSAESDTILDGKTGESGEGIGGQSRVSGNVSYAKETESGTWTPRLGFSSEYDYKSFNAGLNWSKPFAQDNFVLNISGQFFKDQTRLFNYTSEQTGPWEDKDVYSLDISATQMLTRDSIILFGTSYISQSGALESIRNTVGEGSSRVTEELPEDRKRHAYYSQYIHALSDELALSFKYRYYDDDWDLSSHTYEASMRMFIEDEDGFFDFTYRYHDQKATKYYTEEYNGVDSFRTSDSDLASFSAHRFGVHYSYDLGEKKYDFASFDKVELTTGLYHYTRSNDLKYNTIQVGLGVSF